MAHVIFTNYTIITAGSTYLDIDAYACIVAMAELLQLKGENAIAFSNAPCNYSVCESLVEECRVLRKLPDEVTDENANYIIVDVSDPEYIKDSVPLGQITEIFDHHVGFEEYWQSRIGDGAHIEFIGAAATLIFREWKNCGLQDQMSHVTARLLLAAVLDNTLNLTSANTTPEDVETFKELCERENIDNAWCAAYFSEVQKNIEADLKNALLGDVKTVREYTVLPPYVGQLSVWNTDAILERLPEIRQWFSQSFSSWMINIIDIKHRCSYFVCDDLYHQKEIEKVFDVEFDSGVAKTSVSYLRKEIIKKIKL